MLARSAVAAPSVATRGPGSYRAARGLPVLRARSGRVEEPFNEGAAQVRRLVQRDRKELMGNADILEKYKTEFGDGADGGAAPASTSAAAAAAAPAAAPAAPAAVAAPAAPASSSPFAPSAPSSSSSPFGAAGGAASPFAPGAASPFAAGAAASPFGAAPLRPSRLASIEPKGLSPDMGPDPIIAPPKDTRSWLARITLTQVVLFLSFSTIIGIMIATFVVVVKTGAVRLAGIE
ncbi:hypothetical protein Rsub_11400 [Raphidocelis subcapitata]|uniref:Uncharacterized protein n=1 Tax=Raphidocelis subcapitata TaxID=307507 RepID=A0A2V0PFW7_9CHLO|nr:hypothetical protein Rsub_11400 [Raphidocelis subcapitata]|eukprot:GBF98686.1 hypothetical protein Rsub_11400 [Raphidocelis subcapitata]